MTEPLEMVGVWLGQRITGHHNRLLTRYVGSPDAYCRSGCRDNPLWVAERIYSYTADRRPSPGPNNAPNFFTTVEAARFVGITERALRRVLRNRRPCALLLPASYARPDPLPLWSERLLFAIRKLIAAGDIEVNSRSLIKPKLGVKIVSARHTLASDQRYESEQLKRNAGLFDSILW